MHIDSKYFDMLTCNLLMTILLGYSYRDYYEGPYHVTFPAGVTTAWFTITIRDDSYLELTDETFGIAINDLLLPKDITYGKFERATVTIVSDESKCIKMYVIIHTHVNLSQWHT